MQYIPAISRSVTDLDKKVQLTNIVQKNKDEDDKCQLQIIQEMNAGQFKTLNVITYNISNAEKVDDAEHIQLINSTLWMISKCTEFTNDNLYVYNHR